MWPNIRQGQFIALKVPATTVERVSESYSKYQKPVTISVMKSPSDGWIWVILTRKCRVYVSKKRNKYLLIIYPMLSKGFYISCFSQSLSQTQGTGMIITPTLKTRKLRHRGMKVRFQHFPDMQQGPGSGPHSFVCMTLSFRPSHNLGCFC